MQQPFIASLWIICFCKHLFCQKLPLRPFDGWLDVVSIYQIQMIVANDTYTKTVGETAYFIEPDIGTHITLKAWFDYDSTHMSGSSQCPGCIRQILFGVDGVPFSCKSYYGKMIENGSTLSVSYIADRKQKEIKVAIAAQLGCLDRDVNYTSQNGVSLGNIVALITPTISPTLTPTQSPTLSPTLSPTQSPTLSPTLSPTATPSSAPTNTPTKSPTLPPTLSPTLSPTATPSSAPTNTPTESPTLPPTLSPTLSPTATPSSAPTNTPTESPTTCIDNELIPSNEGTNVV
eukprot:230751_1